MSQLGIPTIPGYHGDDQQPDYLLKKSRDMGFPVMIKAINGGGGRGMRLCREESQFLSLLESAKNEAKLAFNDDGMIVEKYLEDPKHIEVQIMGD